MWTSDGTTFYAGDCRPGDRPATELELATIALAKAKREKASEIAKALAYEIMWGMVWEGDVYQIDQTSQDRIGNRAQVARDCVANLQTWMPLYEGWIAADNSRDQVFTAQAFLDFAYAAHDHFTEIMLNARALKDALTAATTLGQVEAIDVNSGWPAQE